MKSLNKLYELYIYQLSFLIEVVEFAKKRAEENKLKFFPTENDLNPNTRFTDNLFIKQLANNRDLAKYVNAYKINWSGEEEMIRKAMVQIRDSRDFEAYMINPNNTYQDDKDIFIKIVKKHISSFELLQFYYEERSIFWSDDFHTANLLVIKTIKAFKESWDEFHKLPELFTSDNIEESAEDKKFLTDLYRKVIIRSDEYDGLIQNKVKNWEMDRIAVMDILLIKMALVELIEFPSIPVKVTLNEYIELAKLYSTPKSKMFVNGVLDKLIIDLKEQKMIVKKGRGLLEE
ncbi:MAG: transcription antitermination factor NusB [Bacteroidales bacterium]